MITYASELTSSLQIQSLSPSTLRQRMKRVKFYYHALHVLKTAEPRLRKSIISNCKRELVNIISECLNVLNGNIKLTRCNTRKLRKHKAALRKVAYKRVPFSSKKKLIVQRGGFVLPLLSTVLPTIASLIFRPSEDT